MSEGILLIAIILVPLFGAMLSYGVGSLKPSAAGIIASTASGLSFYFVIQAFFQLQNTGQPLSFAPVPWFEISSLTVHWSFVFDQLSAVMCLLITGVGTLIHIFSLGYMAKDEGRARFFGYLNLFLASMLVLVLGGNLPVLFIGWEGVGLCSYLLIGFWFQNSDYAKAAQKAFVMNRIGDLGLLLGMFVIFYHFNTLEMSPIVAAVKSGAYGEGILTLIGALLLLGAFGKSAQIPLFTWLPDAMAGPTPVSALIHAATMVTAGIYLVARMFPIFDGAPDLQLVIAIIATSTALVAASIALVQTDIKKVLAYSTVSQLGFMFVALAAGAYWVALFHVLTHGFFKACLFLGAGSVIHGCHHEQDINKMGGLARKMPITFASFSIATFAIAGIAPFAGYYSKHAILEAFNSYALNNSELWFLSLLGVVITFTSFLTSFYMGRCWVLTFFGSYKGDSKNPPHEVPVVMWAPVAVLALLSFVGGVFIEAPLANFLGQVLPLSPQLAHQSFLEALSHSWLGALGIFAALICFQFVPSISARSASIFQSSIVLMKRSYFLDEVYNLLIVKPLQVLAWIFWKGGDDLLLEASERTGVLSTKIGGSLGSWLQSGQLRSYAILLLLGLVGLVYLLIGRVS